jgi:hypothetical protein
MGWDEIARINLIGNVGIGTAIGATSKLCVNRNPLHNGGFDFTTSPCVITNLTPSSASALNDPRPILHLCREGTSGEAYGQRLTFSLCRFEHDPSLFASRTRCDIILAENGFINTNIMTLLSSGRVGIGTTSPKSMLELYSTSQTVPEIILSGTDFSTNTTSTSGVAFLLGSNLTNNRQFWIADSSALGVGTTNPVIRIMPNTRTIDAVATNGTTALPLTIGNINSPLYLNGNVIYIDGSGLNDLKVDNYQSNLIYPPSSVSLISNTITLSNNQLNNGIYTVSASSNLATAYLAFDNNTSTEFSIASAYNNTSGTYLNTGIYITSTIVNTNPYLSFYKSPQSSGLTLFKVDGEWIQIFYDRGFVANSFSIGGITANNGKYPKDFILAGSMNGSNWFMLSSQSNISNYVTGSAKTFTFSNFTSYNFYRLIVTKTVSDVSLSIGELKFSGFANTVYANQDTMNSIIYNTGERQFPPKIYDLLDNTGVDLTPTLGDIYNIVPTSYFKKIHVVYTNGRYEIYSSSTNTNGKHVLFDYLYNANLLWGANNYDLNGNINSGILSTIGLNNNYYGEWIIIKMAYFIVLTRFRFYILTAATTLQTNSAPGLWRCYGSIDGVNWNEITDASNNVSTSIATYTVSDTNGKYFEKILPNLFTTPYLYIGWVFNKLSGTNATTMTLQFTELQIFGKTDISNAYNDVWSQSGNNINSTMNIYIDGSGLNNLKLEDNQTLLTFPPGIINMTCALSTSNNQQRNGYYLSSASTNNNDSYNAFEGGNENNFTITGSYNVNGTYNGIVSTYANNNSTVYSGEWIQLYYDKGFVAKSVNILTNITNNNNNPKDIVIVGSSNSLSWDLLSIHSNYTTFSPSNIYSINNNTSYNFYRIIVQNTINSSTLSIGDISFRGVINTSFTNQDRFNNIIYNTNEKRFPPTIYSSVTAEVGAPTLHREINYILPFSLYRKQIITVNNLNYIIYSSTENTNKANLFDFNPSTSAAWAASRYDANGLYQSTGYISDINYKGDWIIIKFPYSIILTRFRIIRSANTLNAPSLWKCYGSVNGIDWTEIIEASNIITGAIYDASSGVTITLPPAFDIPYLFIGWIFNKLAGAATNLEFAELQIFGKDDISNSLLNENNISFDTSRFNNFKLENNNQSNLIYPPSIGTSTSLTNYFSPTLSNVQFGTYVISASSNLANAYLAFDRNLTTEFSIASPYTSTSGNYSNAGIYLTSTFVSGTDIRGEWIQLNYNKGFVANSITISGITGSNAKCPKDFIIAGSKEGSNWILLSSQVGIGTYSPSNIISIYNFTSYNFYRLIVTKTISDPILSIADISFGGNPNTSFIPLDNYNIQLYNTNEKQFPPRVWDVAPATEASSSNEIFNITPTSYLRQQFSLNNHGTYTIFSSSTSGSQFQRSALFNYDFADNSGNNTAHWGVNYTTGTLNSGIINTIGLNNNYYGDWIVVKFPYQILLTRFRFYARSTNVGRAPGFWRCYGSNDGVNWAEITDASNSLPIAAIATYGASDANGNFFEKTVLNLDIPYLYIGWVVNRLSGSSAGETVMNFAEMQIFGKDDISNSYLNVWNKTNTSIFNTLGNVGIGTTNPTQKLTVVGNSYFNGNVGINTTVATGALFEVSDGTNKIKIGGTGGGAHHVTSTNALVFNSVPGGTVAIFRNLNTNYDTLTGYSDRMTIASTGVTINQLLSVGTTLTVASTSTFNGNVSILSNSKLIFNDTTDDMRIQLYNGYGFGINGGILRYNSATNHQFYAGATLRMTIDGSGNVSCTGSITNSSTSYINAGGLRIGGFDTGNSIWQNTGNLGISANTGSAITFAIGNGFEKMRVHTNGYVGISFTTPSYPLHVGTSAATSSVPNGTIYATGSGLSTSTNNNYPTSIKSENAIWSGTGLIYSSDIRIKNNITDISDDLALQQILAIQPKTYNYIDNILRGTNKVYGFIAQQIAEVIPNAVSSNNIEYIPNIYKSFNLTNDIIETTENLTPLLKIDDNIKIYTDELESEQFCKIIEITETSIKIDKSINGKNAFIYGKQINDFHVLNKEYIYTLNVCATQELYKLIQQLQQQVAELTNRISILEAK